MSLSKQDIESASRLASFDQRALMLYHDVKWQSESSVGIERISKELVKAYEEGVKSKESKPLIDCDANPFVQDGFAVEEHRKGGLLDFAKTKTTLFLMKEQKMGRVVGHDLRKDLVDQPVLNANVLDYLLAHPDLIPEEWKGKAVFFWGTIYRDRDGSLCVRYLCWYGVRWVWLCRWLGYDWYSVSPAACGQASS